MHDTRMQFHISSYNLKRAIDFFDQNEPSKMRNLALFLSVALALFLFLPNNMRLIDIRKKKYPNLGRQNTKE